MRSIFTICILSIALHGSSQVVADMENFGLTAGEWLNGDDLNGGWNSGHVFLPNSFNTDYQSWIGWAISSDTDTVTPGFYNLYSAIAGSGAESSTTYALSYAFFPIHMNITEDSHGKTVDGLYITNSTYAYTSMRDGDAFAKKFGGETGEDPDFFMVTIKGFRDGSLTVDSVDYYLADFRFENSDDDYIAKDWEWLDLTSLGNVDSLWFRLTSSDVGQFGMNTPAHFCIDNVTTNGTSTSTRVAQPLPLSIFPNPTADMINIEWENSPNTVEVIGTDGKVYLTERVVNGVNSINVANLAAGNYIARIRGEEVWVAQIVKY